MDVGDIHELLLQILLHNVVLNAELQAHSGSLFMLELRITFHLLKGSVKNFEQINIVHGAKDRTNSDLICLQNADASQ